MKSLPNISIRLPIVLLTFLVNSAEAISIQVDEWGNMSWNGQPAAPGVMGIDPFSGRTALMYNLPFAGMSGDWLIHELNPDLTLGPLSDIARFDGQGHLFFYSLDAQPFAPADVTVLPAPLNLSANAIENADGTCYCLPNPGPGYDVSGPTYNFVSIVPEPGSVLFLGFGAVLLVLRRLGTDL